MTISRELQHALEAGISSAAGVFSLERATPAAGGCIHRCFVVEGGGRRYFTKVNNRSLAQSFAAEADGLGALAKSGARVPAILCRGETGAQAFLVLEYLDLRPEGDYAALARMLAKMHSVRGEFYGWHRDNFIGATPQANPRNGSWSSFWRDARLTPQLALAERNRLGSGLQRKGERLAAEVHRLLPEKPPPSCLLHGDLWRGNAGFLPDGAPVLFDPAVYFGDRETDFAMAELFGGFPTEFHAALGDGSRPDPAREVRKTIYQLYHVLNHANLFGGSYAARAERMMERLLAEV